MYQKSILENEAELVEQAKTDDHAFGVVYDFYFPKIYGYIYKRTGNKEVCEDLVSEIFLKVFTNLHKYKFKGYSFSAWLYRIATNHLTDYYRKESKAKNISLDKEDSKIQVADQKYDIKEIVDNNYNKEFISYLISKLSVKYQIVINLRYFAQKDYDEIAKIMKISTNNARVLSLRAINKFAKIYEKYAK